MKITIYDTVHVECVIPLAMVLQQSADTICFIVHPKMKNDLETALPPEVFEKYQWIFQGDTNLITLFRILDNHVQLNGCELFWLNTNDSKFLSFYLLKKKHRSMQMLINVHEINNFFKPKPAILPRKCIRFIGKKLLAHATDAFIVNTTNLKIYMEEQRLTQKKLYVIPAAYFDEARYQAPAAGRFTVIIAGSVDERRKDYRTALSAWKQFVQMKSESGHVKLVLAGPLTEYGKEIAAICREKTLQASTLFFEGDIPEPAFRQLLASATILLSPLQLSSSTSDDITEVYGVTKNSGNTADAIKHAKPVIVPDKLEVPGELVTSVLRYRNETELSSILLALYNNTDLVVEFSAKALANARLFSFKMMWNVIDNMLVEIKQSHLISTRL